MHTATNLMEIPALNFRTLYVINLSHQTGHILWAICAKISKWCTPS